MEAAERLRTWLAAFERVFVLTGAGCSTASGIPDYRDAGGQWKRPPPVTYQAFVGEPAVRARYWARSMLGWPRVAAAMPNAAHRALAQWQASGPLSALVTQNVDGLHQRAGSDAVIDLHGRLDEVVCLACSARLARSDLQRQLQDANPGWSELSAASAPDGDADLDGYDFGRFRVPDCPVCGGLLKPDVVFFGENVPRMRYQAARAALEDADAVLVVGSSLMVYSGFRFVRLAHETGKPTALLNRGHTRADTIADLKLDADCVEVLPRVVPGQRIAKARDPLTAL
jgi:NAD-dependent SIR2 family protein deacetylase